MSIGRGVVKAIVCVQGLCLGNAAASEPCSMSGASYLPIGQASEEGWRIEFGNADFKAAFTVLVYGPFDGSPVELAARLGTIGGWPYHIDRAPAAFFSATLESATPYKTAPRYMFVHQLDATLAYRTTKGMTIGLGAPMWQLAGCRAN
jgi:hypothetical protein